MSTSCQSGGDRFPVGDSGWYAGDSPNSSTGTAWGRGGLPDESAEVAVAIFGGGVVGVADGGAGGRIGVVGAAGGCNGSGTRGQTVAAITTDWIRGHVASVAGTTGCGVHVMELTGGAGNGKDMRGTTIREGLTVGGADGGGRCVPRDADSQRWRRASLGRRKLRRHEGHDEAAALFSFIGGITISTTSTTYNLLPVASRQAGGAPGPSIVGVVPWG